LENLRLSLADKTQWNLIFNKFGASKFT